MAQLRKIELMHHIFGKCKGTHICKACKNLMNYRYRNKAYKKCLVYGSTSSEASDWAYKYEACGMFNKDWNGIPIIELKKRGAYTEKKEEEIHIDGQTNMFDKERGVDNG